MKQKIKIGCVVSILFFSLTAVGEIYRTTDADGVVTYSDQPTPQSQAVKLPAVNITTQPQSNNTTNATNTNTTDATTADEQKKSAEKRVPYTSFVVTSPADQETFQNAESIPVSVSFSPALQMGDKIEYMMDGKLVSDSTTNSTYSIPKMVGDKLIIDRGSHTIQARIIDTNGDVVATTPAITIFAHYATVNQQQVR